MKFGPRILDPHSREQLRAELIRVGAEPSILEEAIARSTFRIVRLDQVSLLLARLLYQELTMEGGLVVTAPRLEHTGEGSTAVLLCATRYQIQHLCVRLRWQESEELKLLADELEQVLDGFERLRSSEMKIGPARLEWGKRTYVMGILNITPDSFSGDGLIRPGDKAEDFVARALAFAQQLVDEGADLLDIGGESTHPDASPVDEATELGRVLPVVEALAARLAVPLSVDTYKAAVARAALAAGAHLINDISGLQRDPELKQVLADRCVPVVVTHNWIFSQSRARRAEDVIGVIIAELREQCQAAIDSGISPQNILVDPGIGFGKSAEQNLRILDRLSEFKSLGFPLLIGPSNKGFISRVLGVSASEREPGTSAAVVLGIARGADVVRVHDVKQMARVARMTDSLVRGEGLSA